MSNQQLDDIFGEPGRGDGDYEPGDKMTFREQGKAYTGQVIHVSAPSRTVPGIPLPIVYKVDCKDGFPHIVLSNQIVQKR